MAWLAALAVGMFGFAFALVPLYNVFCELTGLNGKTAATEYVADAPAVVSSRFVTIQFLAQVGNGLPWEFRPTEHELRVQVGTINTTNFYVRNRTARVLNAQAVPSVSPGRAAAHLRKIECFCFDVQTLEPGADMEMPVRFIVTSELPDDVNTLSLSYTIFPAGAKQSMQTKVARTYQDDAQELRL